MTLTLALSMTLLALDCSVAVSIDARQTAARDFEAGKAAIAAQEWADAEAALSRAAALDPHLALAHYGLGQTYMAQRRFEDAVAAFSAARDAFSCAALSEGERRRRVEEIRFLRDGIRASERRSGDASLERGIGETASRAGRILSRHEAERRLHELEVSLRSTKPAPAGVALALGTALFQAGNLAEAELQFRSVVARDPGSGDAHHNLALICALTDRLDEAEREIDAARRAGVSTHPRLRAEVDRRRRLKSAAAGQETGGR